ncbi:hypothetical protein KP509_13G015600 [Ceratopteris richardii]|uniref:CBM20 domain-containing protein n=1 Tax=Ceratopteris richardii TaxID=49495 RepID=A0A8T2TFR8_CERRI|nr:hypothetical protein KP509_13G015600 [Ceratopteris richardii]KAH7420646.1 hypothetical protein KP509_13G015600 [Ceratopteris richardii]
MGSVGSKAGGTKNEESGDVDDGSVQGSQLYVSLKMEVDPNSYKRLGDLVPHVYGSAHMVGSWDPSKAIVMERETTSIWEISFVAPSDHETLDFKFLLKPRYAASPCIIEEGSKRFLSGGNIMDRDAGSTAMFRFPESSSSIIEFPVHVKADRVSPFALAGSWRAYKENLQSHGSMVRGIPDVSIDSVPLTPSMEGGGIHALELELEHYEVPAPALEVNCESQYEADKAEDPRIFQRQSSIINSTSQESLENSVTKDLLACHVQLLPKVSGAVPDAHSSIQPATSEGESLKTEHLFLRPDNFQGQYVDRGVGNSPRPFRLGTGKISTERDLKLDAPHEDMPKAAGAVAAAAVADRMLGPKEHRQLAVILVGLPARGKTFTSAKLTRYLRWLGHDTKHFNVGKYRRIKHGSTQCADFFRADNQEGVEARNEVAILAMEDMLAWMAEGGQVGIFDATNTTRQRRNMLLKMAEGKCKVIFLETICNDRAVVNKNIALKIQQSPDYADESDYETAHKDFTDRLSNYEKVYEPVEEGSYIKMIDMASGQGGQLQVNNISGYLPGRMVFFLVNTHITPRPILLTRHGESQDNVRGRIGGDPALSEAGERYAKKLGEFVNRRLKSERTASIWTSTLQRTILTARQIAGFPKVQWRALDEINAGVCEGMTYEEIKINMPEEYKARKLDKLRYRYPRGESYLDVIQRLEPVIIELERQRAPVVVISHQAVLRALYAYFADKPLQEIPHLEVPLHTIIEIQMGVTGVQEKRYKLMDTSS